MIWVKVDVDLLDHPRILLCKNANAALGLWLRGLAYTRKHMLDGFVPEAALRSFVDPGGDFEDVAELVSQLLGCGLWKLGDGGYQIWNYAEKGNQTKREILSNAKKSREKMKAWRKRRDGACNPVGNSVTNPVTNSFPLSGYNRLSGSSYSSSLSNSDLISDPDQTREEMGGEPRPLFEEPETPAPPAELDPTPPPQKYQAAYERGIERGIGRPFALIEKHRGALHQALVKHARDANGKTYKADRLLRWIESQARQFAQHVAADEHKFYSGLQPTGWLRWLNETPIDEPVLPRHPAADLASEGNVGPANANSETQLRVVPPQDLFSLASGIGKGGG